MNSMGKQLPATNITSRLRVYFVSMFALLVVTCGEGPAAGSPMLEDLVAEEAEQGAQDSADPDSDSQELEVIEDQDQQAADLLEPEDDRWVTCDSYGSVVTLGRLESSLVDEASGLVVSYTSPGVLWTHNDSGGGPELFAFTRTGAYLGTLTLSGAGSRDWEDMAAGPCSDQTAEQVCLYVGDIGDNQRARTELVVYRLLEPTISTDEPFDTMEVSDWVAFPYQYPDGAHDAESLFVDRRGVVYILTKVSRGASRLYRFPDMTPGSRVTLEDLGELSVGDSGLALATAADMHPSGRRLLVRTYLSALEWILEPGQTLADLPGTEGREVPFQFELQGEAIAYDPILGGYVHLSEGLHPDLYWIPCAD